MSAKKANHKLTIAFSLGLLFISSCFADEAEEALPVEEIRTFRKLQNLSDASNLKRSQIQVKQLIRQALENSPALREARYIRDASLQEINAAKGSRLPQVSISSGFTNYVSESPTVSRPDRPYYGLNATMPLYDFGRIDAQIKGRQANFEATDARYAHQLNQLTVEIVTTCLQYTKQQALFSVAVDYLQTVQNLADMLTKITEADPGRRGELVQVQSRLLQAYQAKENARSTGREFQVRLERILGANKSIMCDGIGSSFYQKPNLDEIRSEVQENPQVRAFNFDYQAALRQLDQIKASRKPQVQATAVHAPVASGLSNTYYQNVTISASMPLYDGNVLESNERAALERAKASAERVEQTIKQIESDNRERYQEASGALRRAEEYVKLLEINDQVRKDFFVQWYALGRRSLFELLAMELEQFNLQQGYFTSLFDGMIGVATILGNAGRLSSAE